MDSSPRSMRLLCRASVFTSPGKPRRRLTWAISLLCLGGASILVLRLCWAPLLCGIARAWVVDEPAMKADAIVVLGGGLAQRPFTAARLYHEEVAPRILYMDTKPNPVVALGLALPEKELTRRILLANNVPQSAMESIGNGVANTYDESCAVRAWANRTGAKSIVIVTDLFHTRRARWIFRRELKGGKVDIHVRAAPLPNYGTTNWWKDEEGLVAFETEVVKSGYYWLKY